MGFLSPLCQIEVHNLLLNWKSFHKGLGSKLNLSTIFHPKTDGQEERTIHILEYVLGDYWMDIKGNWNDHLSRIEFAYNNSYHSSIQMSPYKHFMREDADLQLGDLNFVKQS